MKLINELDSRLDRLLYALTRFGLSETAALMLVIDVCHARLKKLRG